MKILKAAALYFAIVFAVGFVLGVVRTLWIAARLGVRWAEIGEMPLMVFASFLAARWLGTRVLRGESQAARLLAGLVALAFLLAVETALGVMLGRGSVTQVLLDRDPVSGPAYYASLAIFGVMPWLLGRSSANRRIGGARR